MQGRRRGRPTKWVEAAVEEGLPIGRSGITFAVWSKWRKKRKKLGTLTVSVGGLRWWPHKSPLQRQCTWEELAEWLDGR